MRDTASCRNQTLPPRDRRVSDPKGMWRSYKCRALTQASVSAHRADSGLTQMRLERQEFRVYNSGKLPGGYRLSLSYYLKKMTDSGQFLKGHPTSIKLADTEGQTAARRIKQFLGNSKTQYVVGSQEEILCVMRLRSRWLCDTTV